MDLNTVGGGTGSGLSSVTLARFFAAYGKKFENGLSISPPPLMRTEEPGFGQLNLLLSRIIEGAETIQDKDQKGAPQVASSETYSTIYPQHSSPSGFQIQILLLSGKTLLLWVSASDVVLNLLRDLELRLGIPAALLRLTYEGKQLKDSLTLSH